MNAESNKFSDPARDILVEPFFNVVETDTLALSEHLSFEFLDVFDMFAPAEAGCDECHS